MDSFPRQWRGFSALRFLCQRPNRLCNSSGAHIFSLVRWQTTGTIDNERSFDNETKSSVIAPFNGSIDLYGRTGILDRLDQTFTSHRRAALIGLDGIGKSLIAIKYAEKHLKKHPETPILWVRSHTPASFRQSYSQLADALKLAGRDDQEGNMLKFIYEHLSNEQNGPWFMVLDDVKDRTLRSMEHARRSDSGYVRPLSRFLPKCSHGSILITSRDRSVLDSLIDSSSSIITVHALEEADSINLLRQHSRDQDSASEDAEQLASSLDNHPLALTQAATYISKRFPKMGIKKYLSSYRKPKSAKSLHTGIHSPISRTWQLPFDRIRKKHSHSFDLLSLMSILHFDAIPAFMFAQNRKTYEKDNSNFEEDVVQPLIEYSLITRDGDSFAMHELVQQATRSWLQANHSMHRRVCEALKIITDSFPDIPTNPAHWSKSQLLLPHAQAALSIDAGPENQTQRKLRGKLLYRIAYSEYESGDHATALRHFIEANKVQSEVLEPDDEELKKTTNMINKLQHALPPSPPRKQTTPPQPPAPKKRIPKGIIIGAVSITVVLDIALQFESTRQVLESWLRVIWEVFEKFAEGRGEDKEEEEREREVNGEKGWGGWEKWVGNGVYALVVSKLF